MSAVLPLQQPTRAPLGAIAKAFLTVSVFGFGGGIVWGPNMILMMGLIGWKVSGLAGALAASTATFAPPCAMYFAAFRLMRRFQEAHWQRVLRSALIPVTTGLIIASGIVMAQAAGITWTAVAVTGAAVVAMLTTRLNPLWLLAAGGALGGLGLLV
jgi:chromate transporter